MFITVSFPNLSLLYCRNTMKKIVKQESKGAMIYFGNLKNKWDFVTMSNRIVFFAYMCT